MLSDVEKSNHLLLSRLIPVTTLVSGPRVHLSGLPTCLVVYVQKSNFHLINMLCVVIIEKMY